MSRSKQKIKSPLPFFHGCSSFLSFTQKATKGFTPKTECDQKAIGLPSVESVVFLVVVILVRRGHLVEISKIASATDNIILT
jgi:hypothetical protein